MATDVPISSWLLGFGLFIFLSLAFVKRYTELLGQNGNMPGRGYTAADSSCTAAFTEWVWTTRRKASTESSDRRIRIT